MIERDGLLPSLGEQSRRAAIAHLKWKAIYMVNEQAETGECQLNHMKELAEQ